MKSGDPKTGPTIIVTLEGGRTLVKHPFWWCKAVTGFNQQHHCAACLRGPFLKLGGRWAPPMNRATPYVMPPRAVCLYFCGVSTGGWIHNFHAPLTPEPGAQVILPMFGSQVFVADGAKLLEIPPLPEGFGGLPKSFWSCRNFQFAVSQFGYRDPRRPLFVPDPADIDHAPDCARRCSAAAACTCPAHDAPGDP